MPSNLLFLKKMKERDKKSIMVEIGKMRSEMRILKARIDDVPYGGEVSISESIDLASRSASMAETLQKKIDISLDKVRDIEIELKILEKWNLRNRLKSEADIQGEEGFLVDDHTNATFFAKRSEPK